MLAAKARRDRPFLERIVQGRLRLEEVAHGDEERRDELRQEYGPRGLIEPHRITLSAPDGRIAGPPPRSPPWPKTAAGTPSSRAASTGRSGSAARRPWPWRTGRT